MGITNENQKRLESWKAVANYLNRSVRTVRRWENTEGLPVHRHLHGKGSTVYAYCNELDAWLAQHEQRIKPAANTETNARGAAAPAEQTDATVASAALPGENLKSTPPATFLAIEKAATAAPVAAKRSNRWPRYAPLALLLLIFAGALSHYIGDNAEKEVPQPASAPKWVLISATDNRTGLEIFDRSFADSLRREFSGFTPHRQLPRARVARTLRLLRKDPQAPLTPNLAHDVGARNSTVAAVLVPRADKMGNGYLLSVDIDDPEIGVAKATVSIEVSNLQDVLSVFTELARDARQSLQRLPLAAERTPVPLVTTSSIGALRLYAHAREALLNDQPEAARAQLQLAIDMDPEFVSAKALQAWALRRSGQPLEKYFPVARAAAVKLGDLAPEEHYFIVGTYQYFSGETEHAEANYSALLRLSPTNFIAGEAMLELCLETRSADDCVPWGVKLAAMLPAHFEFNVQAAKLLAFAGETKQAARYVKHARQLFTAGKEAPSDESVAWVCLFPVMTDWAERDLTGAMQESQKLRKTLPNWSLATRDLIAEDLGEISLALGRIQDAESLFDLIGDPARRHELRARALFARDELDALRKHLAAGSRFQDSFTARLMALTGLSDQAKTLLDALPRRNMSAAQAQVIHAELALTQGRLQQAKTELKKAIPKLAPSDREFYFLAPDLLAATFKVEGKLNEAVNVLEVTARRRRQAAYNGAGFVWLICQQQLAELYHQIGRHKDARQIEEQLRAALRFADQNHPLIKNQSADPPPTRTL